MAPPGGLVEGDFGFIEYGIDTLAESSEKDKAWAWTIDVALEQSAK
jgi:hypothetical protein